MHDNSLNKNTHINSRSIIIQEDHIWNYIYSITLDEN